MSNKAQVTLNPHVNNMLDQLSDRSSLTRSEVVRQAIILVSILTNIPYDRATAFHAVRTIRAQIGPSDALRMFARNVAPS